MPVATSVHVEGLAQLGRTLRRLDADAAKQMRAAGMDAARVVATHAKTRAPSRTGRLRDSIRPGATQRGATVRAGSSRVPYAGPIHFGWRQRNIRPQPFLYDALDHRRADVIDVFERGIADVIRQF